MNSENIGSYFSDGKNLINEGIFKQQEYIPDMNGVYHAGNLESLIQFLGVCQAKMGNGMNAISILASALSSYSSGGDCPNLATAYDQISVTAKAFADKTMELLADLKTSLNTFMEETLTNESTTSEDVEQISSNLQAALTQLDSINWKK